MPPKMFQLCWRFPIDFTASARPPPWSVTASRNFNAFLLKIAGVLVRARPTVAADTLYDGINSGKANCEPARQFYTGICLKIKVELICCFGVSLHFSTFFSTQGGFWPKVQFQPLQQCRIEYFLPFILIKIIYWGRIFCWSCLALPGLAGLTVISWKRLRLSSLAAAGGSASFTGNCTSRKVSLFSHLAPKYPRCRLKVRSFSCVALSSNIDSFISRWLGWSPVCVLLVGEDRFSRSCATTISAPAGQKHENILTFSVLRPEPQQLPPAPSPAGRALRRAADARGWFHISSHLQHFNLFRFLVSWQ